MNLVPIKREKKIKDGKEVEVFVVSAMSITQSDGNQKKFPHPEGNDILVFSSLEKAQQAIEMSGFSYKPVKKFYMPKSHAGDLVNVTEPLINLLSDTNSDVVASAACALGEIASYDAIKPLIDLLGKDDNNIRKSVIEALSNIGQNALDPVIEALNDNNWVKRNSAAHCLIKMTENKNINLISAIGPLAGMLDDSNSIVKSSCALALGKVYANVNK